MTERNVENTLADPPGVRPGSYVVADGDSNRRAAGNDVAVNGRDRASDLLRITGFDGGNALFSWFGTRENLISKAREDRKTLILHIERIAHAERQRGLAGHWSYDLPRHCQINALLAVERAELDAMEFVS